MENTHPPCHPEVAEEETEAEMCRGGARGLVEEEEAGVLPEQLAFVLPPGCWLHKSWRMTMVVTL